MMPTHTVDNTLLSAAAERLAAVAPPGSRVLLFGSRARGDAAGHSDIDFLLVEPQVADRVEEMYRLRRALDEVLQSCRVPVDVIVFDQPHFDRARRLPHTVAYHAAREGQWLV